MRSLNLCTCTSRLEEETKYLQTQLGIFFIVFVLDFVEGKESKIIEWVGVVHGEDKVDAS